MFSVRNMKPYLLLLAVTLLPQIRTESCPCDNGGTCVQNDNTTTCICPPDYTGANCSDLIRDDCSQVYCDNGGTCVDGVCLCAPGYTDSNCTIAVDNCNPQPCQNGGTCLNGINSYTCACQPGFTDSNCNTTINNCAPQPCQNGGTCLNGINSYTCACLPGFTDSNCNTVINICASQPCQNGGTCLNGVNTFTCQCPPTFVGSDCSTLVCPADYCLNGGTCSVTLGTTLVCRCPLHTQGIRCEFVDEITDFVIQASPGDCTVDYCKNGGTCVPGTNVTAILCRCPPSTAGNQCELASQVPAFDGVKTGLIIGSSLGAALLIGILGYVLYRYAQNRRSKRQRSESKTLGSDKDSLLLSNSVAKDETRGQYNALGQK